MTAELTNTEKLRRIHWNTAMSALNTVFAQLTYFGSAFPLFLAELNFTNTQIGILLSFIPFTALVALVLAPMSARWGYKRTFVTFFGIRKFITAFLLLVPLVQARLGTQAVLIYVTVVLLVFSIVRSVAEMGFIPWAQEFIPNSIRGKYTAINDIVSRLTAVAAIGLAGFILALPFGIEHYMLMFGIALFFGVGAVWAAAHIPGGAPIKEGAGSNVSFRHLLQTLKDKNLSLYLAGLSLLTLGTGPLGAFLPLFMEREVGLSESQVVTLQLGGLLGGLSSTYLMGWAADRYGSKPVMLLGVYLKLILPLAWLLMPRHSEASLPIALAASVANGIADIAWIIGSARLLYIGVVPPEKKTEYLGMYYAVAGLVGGLSSVIGGRLLDFSAGISGQFLIFTLDPFTPLFVGGMLLTFVCVFLFRSVKDDSNVSVSEFAGMFMHGNPVGAFESMFRYYRAKDERTTVVMTERMGQTKSPLTVDELLEALHDPRFNVRFEAIISIGRMNSDPRLVDALRGILDGTELSLSTMAAWALGRMGDESALPSLRKGLNSEYRSIRAHCARALATLGDTSIKPILLERLPTETDKGLKVAYAAALGRMGSPEVADAVFAVLDEMENEGARMELALSIARMTGHEQPFIRLLRQARSDRGTAVSQTISSLKKRFPPEMAALADESAMAFARDNYEAGVKSLAEVVSQLPKEGCSIIEAKILDEANKRLRESGTAHLEYLILVLHTLDVTSLHLSKAPDH